MDQNTPETGTEPDALASLSGHLAAIDAEVGAATAPVGAPAGEGGAEPEAAPVQDVAGDVAGLLQMAVAMVKPALPFIDRHYTPDACQRIGVAFAAVAEKRGWNLTEVMTPELALVIAAAPPTIGAVMEARAFIAYQREQAQAARRQEAAGAPKIQPEHLGAAAAG